MMALPLDPLALGREVTVLSLQHALDFDKLRAADRLAAEHHVLGAQHFPELRLRERKLSAGLFPVESRRFGVRNLAVAQSPAAAIVGELRREVMADAERH